MDSNQTGFSIERDIDSIPTISASKTRLFNVLEDNNASIAKVEEVIASDPAMASKVIKLANSPFYRHTKESVGIHDAILTIGFDMVKCITLSISVMETFGSNSKVTEELWRASYMTALSAIEFGRNRNEREWLFTGGLLHDLGRMVLISKAGEHYLPLVDKEGNWPDLEQEKEVFGQDHTIIGSNVATRWHFPREVITIIHNHHQPLDRLSAIVYLVNTALKRVENHQKYEAKDVPTYIQKLINEDINDLLSRIAANYSKNRDSIENLI